MTETEKHTRGHDISTKGPECGAMLSAAEKKGRHYWWGRGVVLERCMGWSLWRSSRVNGGAPHELGRREQGGIRNEL